MKQTKPDRRLRCTGGLVLLAALAVPILSPSAGDELLAGFINPPPEARMRCYWWWLNGHTTEAAITRDLEQMKAKGYGGALLVDANGSDQQGNQAVPTGPMFGAPEWRVLYRHAIKEADRLGLEISLNIQSGWNLGSPRDQAGTGGQAVDLLANGGGGRRGIPAATGCATAEERLLSGYRGAGVSASARTRDAQRAATGSKVGGRGTRDVHAPHDAAAGGCRGDSRRGGYATRSGAGPDRAHEAGWRVAMAGSRGDVGDSAHRLHR